VWHSLRLHGISKSMTETDYARMLVDLDRLPNDPDLPMQPSLIWRLLDKISAHDVPGDAMLPPIVGPEGAPRSA
jgi:hypothetical protein